MSRSAGKSPKFPIAADFVGFGLLIAAGLWAFQTASSTTEAGPVVKSLLISAAAFIIARLCGRYDRGIAPAIVVLWAIFVVVQFPVPVFSAAPIGGPFGYVNAKGAFFALTTVAALTLVIAGPPFARPLAAAAAGASVIVPFVSHSYAAGVLAVGVPLISLGIGLIFNWRAAVLVSATLFVVALVLVYWVGANYASDREVGAFESDVIASLTERRVVLWSEAINLIRANPLKGVGPGRFREESPTARSDSDAGWAHNGFLQQGAEQGVLGMALLIAIFLWGFLRLAIKPDAVNAMGSAAIAVLGIHACIDYVLHFGILPITVAFLVGSASGLRRRHWFPQTEWETRDLGFESTLAGPEGS